MRIALYFLAMGLIASAANAESDYVVHLTNARTAPVASNVVQGAAQPVSTPPVPMAAPEQPNAILPQGTAVRMTTEREISSKYSQVGDRVELRVAENVLVNDIAVIPAGTRAVGEVTRVDKKGMFGKSGKIAIRALYARVGSKNISLAGASNDEGSGGTVGVVAAAVLLWPVAPFVTGTSAVLPPGTRVSGYVENDIPLVLRAPAATQQALVVN